MLYLIIGYLNIVWRNASVMRANSIFPNSTWSQSYQTLISSFLRSLLSSLAISKYRQYFHILQTLKLNSKKSSFYEEKSLVGLTPGQIFFLPNFSYFVVLLHIQNNISGVKTFFIFDLYQNITKMRQKKILSKSS